MRASAGTVMSEPAGAQTRGARSSPGAGQGHVELERTLSSIVVGERHRRDLGDLEPLMDSLRRVGLLQPVTITPDGLLICGLRRLEAARQLGWDTLRVWVRSGLSDDLTRLLAERDDNLTHKPLSSIEAARLYRELLVLVKEDAAWRQRSTQFHKADGGTGTGEASEDSGAADSAGPEAKRHPHATDTDEPPLAVEPGPLGDARRRASEMVTGTASYARLEQICAIERIAADRSQPPGVRKVAEDELKAIRNSGPVDPSYQRVMAAARVAALMTPPDESVDVDALTEETLAHAKADRARKIRENRQKRASAAAHARRSPRAFVLTWAELEGWSTHFDPELIAREVSTEDWTLFLRVLDESRAFADSVALARESVGT